MYKVALFLAFILAIQGKIFPPAVEERYHDGQLSVGNVCNIFHFPSDN